MPPAPLSPALFDLPETTDGPGPQRVWPATRAEGLRRLAEFAPAMGKLYKSRRNYDLGPDDRANVSLLSPYIRRRLITEREAVATALSAHSAAASEKFVQEVFWRSYWKGWLQLRPAVWTAYRAGLADDRTRLAENRGLAKAVARAEGGRSGIDAFDAWAVELVETGYLHNHARMWFASIWIFTLGLPWRLGADFFLRHLLDGDAASNTLGWRWVAGLQTRGKNYVARAWNIEKFTGGRFNPVAELDEDARPLVEDERIGQAGEPPRPAPLDGDVRTALLITEEDCAVETLGALMADAPVAIGLAPMAALRSEAPTSEAVAAFDRAALRDAGARAAEAVGWSGSIDLIDAIGPGGLAAWARDAGAGQIATAYAPTGWARERLDAERPHLAAAGVRLGEALRDWDAACWPHATAGFFKFKEQIPALTRRLLG